MRSFTASPRTLAPKRPTGCASTLRASQRRSIHASTPSALPQLVGTLAQVDSLLLSSETANFLPLVGGAAFVATGVAALRIYAYLQIQYVTASMLQRYLPDKRPDLRFLQMGGTTRDLFYFPTATSILIVQDPNANESLLKQAGVQAGVPVEVKTNSYDDLSWRPASSLDGVFIAGTLSQAKDPKKVLREIYRVLKPGAPCVFVQRLKGPGVQAIAGASDGIAPEALNAAITQDAWSLCQYDTAIPSVDPHAVGLLVRPLPEDVEKATRARDEAMGRPKKAQLPKKGFN